MEKAYEVAKAIVAELDNFEAGFEVTGGALTRHGQVALQAEPYIGYAVTKEASGKECRFIFSRNETPMRLEPADEQLIFASYKSQLGRLIAKPVGASHAFHQARCDLQYELLAKDIFQSTRDGARWDATDNNLSWMGHAPIAVRSLRRLLEREEE